MFINEFVWMYRTVFVEQKCVSPWCQAHFQVFTSLCFDANLRDLCKMFFKFLINQKYMLKTSLTGDREFFRSQLRPFSGSQVVSTFAFLG